MRDVKEHATRGNQSGAALITVVMIAALLSIASIAILSGVGSNSRNTTDVLSESKAYYAAESGLQSAINVLRNNAAATYSEAVKSPNDLSSWLTYNCTAANTVSIGPNPCTVNGTAYRLSATDPDNSGAALTFSSVGTFDGQSSFPNATDANRIDLTFTDVTNCGVTFSSGVIATHCGSNANPLLSTLNISKIGSGASAAWSVPILINYTIVNGSRSATRTIRGKIEQASALSPIVIDFDASPQEYSLIGTDFKLCPTSTTTTCGGDLTDASVPPPASGTTTNQSFFMTTTPLEPYRLKVSSIGFGPNGARKQLEGIIQHDFFNGGSGPAAITMQGTATGMEFSNGNAKNSEITGNGGIPSIGVVDPAGLPTVEAGIQTKQTVLPPPAVVTDLPDWMTTPQKLDALVSQLRSTAINSGRYFLNPGTISSVGNYSTGEGITFCEGDCKAGVDGGGILVVTGKLTNVGGWNFKGLIIVTGVEGWERKGGGNGVITGNALIAPYTSAQLTSNVFSLPPKYNITGGGTSELEYDNLALSNAFNGTDAISNFMLGVAEK